LNKTPDTHLDFDFDLAKEHSLKNPIYYIQYAHTRCCGILREAKFEEKILLEEKNVLDKLKGLTDEKELLLIKKICLYEDILDLSLEILSPHPVCNYLLEVSKTFHKFYESCRVIELNGEINLSRVLLIYATKTILRNGLNLLGISAPEKM
jgi:arginyl-tRNA synthetase